MKTILLIIIGIVIASTVLILTSGIFTPLRLDITDCKYADDQGSIQPCIIIDGWYDVLFYPESSLLENESELNQLQLVLDYCNDSNPKDSYGLKYYNETHYIDNNLCEWQKIEKYPNSTKLCIPHSSKSYTDEEIRNANDY